MRFSQKHLVHFNLIRYIVDKTFGRIITHFSTLFTARVHPGNRQNIIIIIKKIHTVNQAIIQFTPVLNFTYHDCIVGAKYDWSVDKRT